MGMKEIVTSFIVLGLFAFALLNLGLQIGVQNEANENLLDNTLLNETFSNLSAEIDANDANATSSLKSFQEEGGLAGAITGVFFSVVTSIGKTISSVGMGIYNITVGPFFGILQLPGAVEATIGALIAFLVTLLLWRLYRSGS